LKKDPRELHNIIDTPEGLKVLPALKTELEGLIRKYQLESCGR